MENRKQETKDSTFGKSLWLMADGRETKMITKKKKEIEM